MRAAGLVLAPALCTSEAAAQQAFHVLIDPANRAVLEDDPAEFPPIGPAYGVVRPERMAAHADRLLAEAPDAPGTFEILVYVERVEEAATVLRRIIGRSPGEMVEPFELLLRRRVFAGRR